MIIYCKKQSTRITFGCTTFLRSLKMQFWYPTNDICYGYNDKKDKTCFSNLIFIGMANMVNVQECSFEFARYIVPSYKLRFINVFHVHVRLNEPYHKRQYFNFSLFANILS